MQQRFRNSGILVCLLMFAFAFIGVLQGQTYKEYLASKGDLVIENIDEPLMESVRDTASNPELTWSWSPEPRWLSSVNFGLSAFFGGLGLGGEFFGSTLTFDQMASVEIRFDSNESTLCQTYRRDQGYAAAGVGTFPGSAWDMSDPNNPRRLNICFVENNTGSKPANLQWDPDDSGLGGREYLFIMLSDYDGTGQSYDDSNWGPGADVLYSWWPKIRNGYTAWETNPAVLSLELAFVTNFYAIPSDGQLDIRWQFDQPGAASFNLYYGTSNPPTTLLANQNLDNRRYVHTGLTNNATYYYKVEAVNGSNEVLFSSRVLPQEPEIVSNNMTITGSLHEYNTYGDIWGYTSSAGREYALLCLRDHGLSIIDVTDAEPVEVGFVPSINPGGSDSKDVKVYGDYAYLVNEREPIQIIDLSDPTNPQDVGEIDLTPVAGGNGAHNAYVDGDYLYVVGDHGVGGLLIYHLLDPTAPNFVGRFEPFYYHDVYVRNDTAYVPGIYGDGVDILDVSVKTQPSLIARFNYPGSGAHNVWTTEDGDYLYVGDEIGSSGNHIRVFDARDLDNIDLVATYIANPQAVTHNHYVKGDYLYVGYYTEGVRVLDISNPADPQEVAYYDTYPFEGFGYNGCWSVYPYFESGKIIASDQSTGLYVLEMGGTTAIDDNPRALVDNFELAQNYPNPFNPSTTIRFSLPATGYVTLKVYNLNGQEVATLVSESRSAGWHSVDWNAENVSSGIYFYQLQMGENISIRKLILLK